jgi:mRNA interferase YafQ
MRTIERTKAFHRDWKKVGSGVHGKRASGLLQAVVTLLVEDRPLPTSSHDHRLTGEWADHRECHLRPDLLLIYRKPNPETLQLVRLGSHSELFG